jgi:hypothetical protein
MKPSKMKTATMGACNKNKRKLRRVAADERHRRVHGNFRPCFPTTTTNSAS